MILSQLYYVKFVTRNTKIYTWFNCKFFTFIAQKNLYCQKGKTIWLFIKRKLFKKTKDFLPYIFVIFLGNISDEKIKYTSHNKFVKIVFLFFIFNVNLSKKLLQKSWLLWKLMTQTLDKVCRFWIKIWKNYQTDSSPNG